jgi:hypothetical protein
LISYLTIKTLPIYLVHTQQGNNKTQTGENKMTRTKKDNKGRVWSYCDGEGSWSHGEHIIGCGRDNGSKWQVWGGPNTGHYEYKTLKEAMEACE